MERLLIIGIDPGTTLGYALLDVNGNVIRTDSSKQYDINSIIREITSHGKPLIAATDKKQCPSFIENFAIKIGAKLVSPDHDLSVNEKREICHGYKCSDSHQRDSLASALFAFSRKKKLFDKIDNYLSRLDLMDYSMQVKEVCVKRGVNIFDAVDSLIKRPERCNEKPIESSRKIQDTEKLLLKNRIKKLSCENDLLRKHNTIIKRQVYELESLPRINRIKKLPNRKVELLVNSKENTIFNLQKEIDSKDMQIAGIRTELDRLNSFIADSSGKVLLKKLDNLGWDEFQKKNKVLNVMNNDILYVKNISVVSRRTLGYLKDRVNLIIYERGKSDLDFVLMDTKGLEIAHNCHFALVDKDSLDKKRKEINLLRQIVNGYRR